MTTDPSSDVLERLRHMANTHHAIKDCAAMTMGADLIEAQSAAIERLSAELERLKDHIFGHAEFAEYRIKDGDEMGARVWRIALEDVAKENRAALRNEVPSRSDDSAGRKASPKGSPVGSQIG